MDVAELLCVLVSFDFSFYRPVSLSLFFSILINKVGKSKKSMARAMAIVIADIKPMSEPIL